MDIDSILDFIYSKTTDGIKLGLDRVSDFASFIGNPHKKFKSIHIAGTNGKGTVSTLLYNTLKMSGLKCGIYISPHLLRFNERIVVDGREISDNYIIEFFEKYKDEIEKRELTFFEITTVLAFQYFKDESVDIAIIETGLGGRLDATNILLPEVCAITDISVDHEKYLTADIEKIAYEKGGIIKPDTSLVFGITDASAKEVIQNIASDYTDVLAGWEHKIISSNKYGTLINLKTKENSFKNLEINISGDHHILNVLIAIGVLEKLKISVPKNIIRKGISSTSLMGRLQLVSGRPDILFDVAHNLAGICALDRYLKSYFNDDDIIIVFGVMEDKDYTEMFNVLNDGKRKFIFTTPKVSRAADSKILVEKLKTGKSVSSVADALSVAKNETFVNGLVVVAGSFFTVAEAMTLP